MPLPLRAIVSGEFGALLVIEMLPVTLPAVVGENSTVNVGLCPALIVNGVDKPLRLNPVPVMLAAEIVTLEVSVSVTVCDPLLPTKTLPKLTLVGLAASVARTPVPLKAIVAGDPEALLVTVMLPVALPADVGANVTVKVAFVPALIVAGTEKPLTLNPGPVMAASVTLSAALPVFDTMIA